MMRKRPDDLPPEPLQPLVIAGFDSEWVKYGLLNMMLSYQIVILNTVTGAMCECYFQLDGRASRRAKRLGWLLSHALKQAIREGVIQEYPTRLILAAHFTRADLTGLKDYDDIKSRVTALRKTYATTDIPLGLKISTPNGPRPLSITVVDTMLLSPTKSRLEELGLQLGIPKIELPTGHSKDRMDLFQAEQPEQFRLYAMTDAIIAACWTHRILRIIEDLGIKRPGATLAAVATELAVREIRKHTDLNSFLGKLKSRRGKPQPMPNLIGHWSFAAQCYHGGYNTEFANGFSPPGRDLVDVDIASAYTTLLAMIRIPDWDSARITLEIVDLAVVDEAMTFAYVHFEFPAMAWPCLPIRTSNDHGLSYPREGNSWCCGPELVVALGQGCKIEVLDGRRIDWKPGDVRPLEEFTRGINTRRGAAVADGDIIGDLTIKEIGNSCYGKVSQAVASDRLIEDDRDHRTVFDSHFGASDKLGPSKLSQPMFAAFTTAGVRALLHEILSKLPPTAWLASATTDGLLFGGTIDDIDDSGPVATAFKAERARLTPDNPAIVKIKHVIPGAMIVRTRCAYTHAPADWRGKALIARAGYRLPYEQVSKLNEKQECDVWIEMFRTRTFDTTIEYRNLTSLRDQHTKGIALQEVTGQVSWNADLDLKRKPINVRNVEGLFACDSEPWQTIDDAENARDRLDQFRKSQRRIIKTAEDWFDFEAWCASLAARKAVNARPGKLPTLARAVTKAALRGYNVLPIGGVQGRGNNAAPTYDDLAATLSHLTGRTITKTDIKNVMRRSGKPEELANGITYLAPDDLEFAVRLLDMDLQAMDCLTAICGGEALDHQLPEAYRQACNALGDGTGQATCPASENNIAALATRFSSPEFPDHIETLFDGEKDVLFGRKKQVTSGKVEPSKLTPKIGGQGTPFFGSVPKNLVPGGFVRTYKRGGQDLRHLPTISSTYHGSGGIEGQWQKELVSLFPIMAIGTCDTNSFETGFSDPISASVEPVDPSAPSVAPTPEIVVQKPAAEALSAEVSAVCAALGLSPTGTRPGEQDMVTLVRHAVPVFGWSDGKRVIAEHLGLTVAELRVNIADVLMPRHQASGMSKSAARKRALQDTFDNLALTIAGLASRYTVPRVLAVLKAVLQARGVQP